LPLVDVEEAMGAAALIGDTEGFSFSFSLCFSFSFSLSFSFIELVEMGFNGGDLTGDLLPVSGFFKNKFVKSDTGNFTEK
jgi:hypothetical protein